MNELIEALEPFALEAYMWHSNVTDDREIKIAFSYISGALRECLDAAIDAATQGEKP